MPLLISFLLILLNPAVTALKLTMVPSLPLGTDNLVIVLFFLSWLVANDKTTRDSTCNKVNLT